MPLAYSFPYVKLDDRDLELARRLGEGRAANKSWTFKICGRYSDPEAYYMGAAAEIAGTFALGTGPDADFLGDRGDAGVDALAFGLTWQIKSTPHKGPGTSLKFLRLEDFRADAAMLLRAIAVDFYQVLGVIGRRRFADIARPVDYGYGACWAVDETDLSPVSEVSKLAAYSGGLPWIFS